MSTKYHGSFESRDDIIREFCLDDYNIVAPPEENILYANYCTPPYEGYAFVLFYEGDKLYEVNASHCSCYGLGETDYTNSRGTQWEPEETSLEAIRMRPNEWEGLKEVLDSL